MLYDTPSCEGGVLSIGGLMNTTCKTCRYNVRYTPAGNVVCSHPDVDVPPTRYDYYECKFHAVCGDQKTLGGFTNED